MIRIILGVLLVAVGTLIGLSLSERLRIRKQIFEELIVFNNAFICDIGLYRSSVIDKLSAVEGALKTTFKGGSDALLRGEKFICSDLRLKREERQLISDYVNGLGILDSVSQRESLKLYEEKLKAVHLLHETNYQKTAKLYTRLGFSCGLIVTILLF